MTQENFGGTFLYTGNAQGVASSYFPVVAPVSLPTIGGVSKAEVDGFEHRQYETTFEGISTYAKGSYDAETNTYTTRVGARVQAGRVGDIFRLEHPVEITAVSKHRLGKTRVLPVVLEYPESVKFEFAGYAAQATFNQELLEFQTKDDLKKALVDKRFQKEHYQRFYRRDSLDPKDVCGAQTHEPASEVGGYILYTTVERIEWEGAGQRGNRVDGHVLISGKHGQCSVGETFRSGDSVRSNLFRLTIGHGRDEREENANLFKLAFSKGLGVTHARKGQGDGSDDDDLVIPGVGTNGVYIPP